MEPKDEVIIEESTVVSEELQPDELDKIAGGGGAYGSTGSENT